MKPITNFRDHPALKYDEQKTLIVTEDSNNPELYLITDNEVALITPERILFTNIGEPYIELLKFEFSYDKYWLHGSSYGDLDSIVLDPNDLQDLGNMLYSIDSLLPIPDEFAKYLDSYEDE